MNTNQNTASQSFWLWWVIATTIGFIIGGAVSGTLVLAAEYRFSNVTSAVEGAIALATADAVAFGLHGAALGRAQWFVLLNAITRPSAWIVATAGGWAAAGIVSGILGGAFGGALTGVGPDYGNIGVAIAFSSTIAFLLLPGLAQWLALRRQVGRAGWWVLAQALSFLVATAVAFPSMLVAGSAMGWEFPSAQAWGFAGVLVGVVYGAITGAVMVRLLQQAKSGSSARIAAQGAGERLVQ